MALQQVSRCHTSVGLVSFYPPSFSLTASPAWLAKFAILDRRADSSEGRLLALQVVSAGWSGELRARQRDVPYVREAPVVLGS